MDELTDADKKGASADELLREQAAREGLTYDEFCRKYGLMGPSQERRMRRHEVPG